MKLSELKNKKILIVGYGKEGQSTMKFLRHHLPDAVIETTDQSDGQDYLTKQKNFDLAIKSPGIPKKLISIPYTTATNLFFGNTHNFTIGITGTKGKSTTTSLIYEMLKADNRKVHIVGNIGNPMLEELMKPYGEDDIFVIELSSYQLDDITYSPHISVVLNLFPEHMDYHGNVEKYYEAKSNILKFARAEDYFVYNQDYPVLQKWAGSSKAKVEPFLTEIPFDIAGTKLKGAHNILNIKAATTVGLICEIAPEVMQSAVNSFKPLPHRLELIGEYHGIKFYDDAISTTPESTIAAINSIENISTILLGGQNRGYNFSALAKSIAEHGIKNIVLFPDSGTEIKLELEKVGSFNILDATSMEQAVQFAFAHSPVNSVCLLSTASPSYTLWKNFEEKGTEFQRYVRAYGQTSTS